MPDPLIAEIITVDTCEPDCSCQSVHVRILDADSDCFAIIGISPEGARAMAKDLREAADLAEARKVRNAGRLA